MESILTTHKHTCPTRTHPWDDYQAVGRVITGDVASVPFVPDANSALLVGSSFSSSSLMPSVSSPSKRDLSISSAELLLSEWMPRPWTPGEANDRALCRYAYNSIHHQHLSDLQSTRGGHIPELSLLHPHPCCGRFVFCGRQRLLSQLLIASRPTAPTPKEQRTQRSVHVAQRKDSRDQSMSPQKRQVRTYRAFRSNGQWRVLVVP